MWNYATVGMKDKVEKRHKIDYLSAIGDYSARDPYFMKSWQEFRINAKYYNKSGRLRKRFIRSDKRIAKWFFDRCGIVLLNTKYDLTFQHECNVSWKEIKE